jgi:hypothetical protein
VAVSAYAAALNAHDLPAALALFDQYGSATDAAGRHFEGRAGLTDFLLSNGFGNPTARISTVNLHVVGNRAIWTYTCSCADGQSVARMVMNHDKISVFFILPLAAPRTQAGAAAFPWLLGLGLVAGLTVGGLSLRRRWSAAPLPIRSQGRLLAALRQSRAQPDRRG